MFCFLNSNFFLILQEVDIGIVADVGTLQRLPKIVASQSVVRELCYTGRMFHADEAKAIGTVVLHCKISILNRTFRPHFAFF